MLLGCRMKILLFHPLKSTNTGDNVILQGTENILRQAFLDVEFIHQEFTNDETMPRFDRLEVDLFVVSGTPWFWHVCHRSMKYKQLAKVVALYKDVKKIGLGLGSCYPLTTNIFSNFIYPNENVGGGDWRKDDVECIKNSFGKFDLLFTRDSVAQEILKVAGIESYETVCPAVFAYDGDRYIYQPVKDKSLLIFQHPERSLSQDSCDKEFSRPYVEFQFKLVEKYKMEVKTASPLDSDWLRDVGLLKCEREVDGGVPYSTWIKNPTELMQVLIQYNPVVSCRVHEAIPSRMLGNLTYILPMDTRFLTATKVGVLPLWPYGYPLDLLELPTPDLDKINIFTQRKVKEGRLVMIEKLREVLK